MDKSRVYLDTNIVADIIDSTRLNHNLAVRLLKYLVIENYDICISEDMITTLYYILKDKKQTLEFFKYLIFEDWKVLTFGPNITKSAIDLSLEKNLDLEDLLQCLCAKEQACDLFVTSDKKFHDCGINVVTYSHFKI